MPPAVGNKWEREGVGEGCTSGGGFPGGGGLREPRSRCGWRWRQRGLSGRSDGRRVWDGQMSREPSALPLAQRESSGAGQRVHRVRRAIINTFTTTLDNALLLLLLLVHPPRAPSPFPATSPPSLTPFTLLPVLLLPQPHRIQAPSRHFAALPSPPPTSLPAIASRPVQGVPTLRLLSVLPKHS